MGELSSKDPLFFFGRRTEHSEWILFSSIADAEEKIGMSLTLQSGDSVGVRNAKEEFYEYLESPADDICTWGEHEIIPLEFLVPATWVEWQETILEADGLKPDHFYEDSLHKHL